MILKLEVLKQKIQNNKKDMHTNREITDKLSPMAIKKKI